MDLFSIRFYEFIFFDNCLIDTRCENKTVGTIKHGSHIKGKYNTAILGCSNPNCWKGKGAERIAFTTIFNNKSMPAIFHASINLLLSDFFTKPKYVISGADKPASISKFLPSKVISLGMSLYRKSHSKINSTKILTTCSCVN